VLEGEALERDLTARLGRERCVEADGAVRQRRIVARIRHHDHALQAGQLRSDLLEALQGVEALAVVPVAVGGEQHARLDLTESIENSARAEVGRARGPDRPDARRREHRDHRLRQVGEISRDAVAGRNTPHPQRRDQARHSVVELCERERAFRAVFTAEENGGRVVAPAQQVLGEVEPGLREPLGTRHAIGSGPERMTRPVTCDTAEIPDRTPEGRRLLDGPTVERGVVGQRAARSRFDLARKRGEVGPFDPFPRRSPEGLVHGA
jgi:hypothetical protein